MPNRYEREIEEILRNMETTESKTGPGRKFGERLRRKPEYQVRPRRQGLPSLNFGASEWLTVAAVIAALISGGFAYAYGPSDITGIFAVVGIVCLILLVLSQFIFRSRKSRYATRSTPIGNVTPLRRNPLNSLVTRWNLFLLKWRYRRQNGRK
jgi:hypothetical protein